LGSIIAEENNDIGRIEELVKLEKTLLEEINSKTEHFKSQNKEQARKNYSNQIKTCVEEINKCHKTLGSHLNKHIHKGSVFIYESGITWET